MKINCNLLFFLCAIVLAPSTNASDNEKDVFYRAMTTLKYATEAITEDLREPEPTTDGRIQTLNNMGAMSPVIDPTTEAFIEEAVKSTSVLEVGSAYGRVCIESLRRGVSKYTANDLDERHLQILARKLFDEDLEYPLKVTLVPGSFPEDVHFLDNSFDAILIARVLHFMSPEQATNTLQDAFRILKPGGKLYAVMSSPYVKGFTSFIPIFEEKEESGDLFPGYIENLLDITDRSVLSESHLKSIEGKSFLAFNTVSAARLFESVGFEVIESIEISLEHSITMSYDGRENVGIIAQKPDVQDLSTIQ